MRRRNILLGALALAVVVAAIAGVAYVLHARAQLQADAKVYPGLDGPVSVVCPGPAYSTTGQGRPYRSGQGFPAIHPRNDCTPSFTQQDVRDYVAHGVSLGPSIQADGEPTVTRVVFLTAGDLARATANREQSFSSSMEANYPPDMLVCYVGLSGAFSFVGGPYGGRSSLSATSFVFDAHTGNELVMVAGPLLG